MAEPFSWPWVKDKLAQWAFKEVLGAALVALTVFGGRIWQSYNARIPDWALWATTIVVLVGVALFFNRDRFKRDLYTLRIGEISGLARIFPVAPFGSNSAVINQKARDDAEKAIRDVVRSAPRLQLLLASGWHYIGCETSKGKLFDELSSRTAPFQLDVLLFDPDDPKTEARARAANLPVEVYREGVKAVLWTLAYWQRTKGWTVEVRTYKDAPIWQMVLSEKELWLTCARDTPSDRSPIYCIRREAEYGLHFGLQGVWERRWGPGDRVDLNRVQQPDWARLRDVRSQSAPPVLSGAS